MNQLTLLDPAPAAVETDEPAIAAKEVPAHRRLRFLPHHFGNRGMMVIESACYNALGQMCPAYRGGLWRFWDLSNGGGYLSPPAGQYACAWAGNGSEETVSADAAGIVVTLLACSHASFELEGTVSGELVAANYHLLRDFAAFHPEARAIFALID